MVVWWTMVIGGKDIEERTTADFTENSRWEDLFSKCPHLSPGHTDVLKKQNVGRKYRGGERRGGLAKVMGMEKQLRPVEMTRWES